ncbi:MAG TPA: ThuA domain-containing protein [Bryobacteraceae bacterium]|nr:ThuA domain-containing protein [Bryobacteraceae bacterium]
MSSAALAQNLSWPGKKKLLAIADPREWYGHVNYHHDASSHTLATVERLGRESGAWITVIRTDMELLRKAKLPGTNARTLDDFDAIFYMGEGPWDISDEQKANLLSFVRDDGKGFVAGHAGNGGHLLLWPEYAEMIGGNLVSEFPTTDLPVILEDPKFPGVGGFEKTFWYRDQFTVVGPNFSRETDHVIMRLDASKLDEAKTRQPAERAQRGFERAAAARRPDGDMPIVWARKYGKGRVWYSSFGHEETSLDDPRVQKMYVGAIQWALGLVEADITPRPLP